jgi:hypothetical protein
MENLEDLFKNPFSEYNASVMDSNMILDYWCSPLTFSKSTPIHESEIYQDKMPIVFMGGRGTGKTMFLKYFSYPTQREKALRDNTGKDVIIKQITQTKGIGFYLKFDGPTLRSFEGKQVNSETWDNIFVQYFELQVCKKYVETINELSVRSQIDLNIVNDKFVPAIAHLLGKSKNDIKTMEDVVGDVENKINEVNDFRRKVAFSEISFNPSVAYASQDLSVGAVEIIKNTIDNLKNINFVLLIDEYENYSDSQQRIVNTLMRFRQESVTLRIGMRLEGFHTYATTSENEFIKENRDYRKVIFEEILLKDNDYRDFLLNVARKRLESIPFFKEKGFVDISKILGQKENVENEALSLLKENPRKHFEIVSSVSGKSLDDELYDKLKNTENPLLEMLNILWLLRGNSPESIQQSMNDYLNKRRTSGANKYKRDYIDKYKYSLMFVLASKLRRNKKYYSFNTYCYLSSGIVGLFIELCRRAFQYAYFENQQSLIQKGRIPAELQDRATREVANSELEMIKRVPKYGEQLYFLVRNLGNIFSEYHKDIFIRYPETNQFSISQDAIIDTEINKAFNSALEWSVVQKKPFPQGDIPGGARTEIYTLNHIFSPIYNISYRTRGGYSEEFDEPRLRDVMTHQNIRPLMKLEKPTRTSLSLKKTPGIQKKMDLENGH